MSTTRSLTTGRFPIGEMTGSCPDLAMSYMRVLHASTAPPSMRMPQEPQIIIRQLLRKESVPSIRSLIRSRTSSSVTHSGASTSYSLSARSPVDESYRQILTATSIRRSVLPQLRLPLRHRDRLPAEPGRAVGVERDERVPEVVLVVAVGIVVRPGVSASALLARDTADGHAVRELEQEAELDRLRQVAVEHVALVVDHDVLVALAEVGHDLALLLHLRLAPEDAEVLVHRLGESVANDPRTLAVASLEQRAELTFCVGLRRPGDVDDGVRERPLCGVTARARAGGGRLHQCVDATSAC